MPSAARRTHPSPHAAFARLIAVAAVAAIASAGSAHAARDAPPPPPPQDGARAFYAKVIQLRASGIPGAPQRRALAPLISRPLANDLRAAADAEQRHRRATRNREPPLWEGDVFSSLFEGPREASVERCLAEEAHAQCVVSLSFRDAFGGAHRWQDRAILVLERGRWVVDDVAYEARWAFGNKGTLRANLREVVAQAPPARGKGARPAPRKVNGAAAASRGRGR